jgi:hypothetical protein
LHLLFCLLRNHLCYLLDCLLHLASFSLSYSAVYSETFSAYYETISATYTRLPTLLCVLLSFILCCPLWNLFCYILCCMPFIPSLQPTMLPTSVPSLLPSFFLFLLCRIGLKLFCVLQCNGHAYSCDAHSGECIDCRDSTTGRYKTFCSYSNHRQTWMALGLGSLRFAPFPFSFDDKGPKRFIQKPTVSSVLLLWVSLEFGFVHAA